MKDDDTMKQEHTDLFCSLYEKNSRWLIQWVYRLFGNQSIAEEIVQETFLVFLFKIDELSNHPNIEGWLYKTATHLSKRELKSARNHRETPLNEDLMLPATEYGRKDLFEVLPPMLPENEKEILKWRFVERLPHQEIADRLGISSDACRMRMMRAKRHCLELLEKDKNKK